MGEDAATLKQKGNELFKAGNLIQASELYAKAEQADPSDPVYPSNLSAALFEIGDYVGCVDAVLRSWKLLRDNPDAKPDLILRLSSRLAKTLCHGVRAQTITQEDLERTEADIAHLRRIAEGKATTSANVTAGDESVRVWQEWKTARSEFEDCIQKGDRCLSGLSRLPLFCKPLDPTKEYFMIGTDDVIDLTEGWGPQDPYPLDLNKLPVDLLSKVSFLFGGVGDGRHVLGTLSGLHLAYKKLPKAKQARFQIHLTLLDIHEGIISRNLCLLKLLSDFNGTADSTARTEIKATFMYMFCGAIMPSYCYDRLQGVFADLRKRLTASPPDMPRWLHVVSDSVPAVVQTLEFWAKTVKSTRKMLTDHESINPWDGGVPGMLSMPSIPGANPNFQRTLNDKVAAERENLRNMFLTLSDEQLAESRLIPEGSAPNGARAWMKDNVEQLVDMFHKLTAGGKSPMNEQLFYAQMKAFLPPEELRARHPGFSVAWKQLLDTSEIPPTIKRKAKAHIESEWKPNITLFDLKCADPRCYPDADGYPELKLDMFKAITFFDTFNRRNGPNAKGRTDPEMLAYVACSTFFEEAAAALKALVGRITLELICGGLSEELARMRFKGDLTRPKEFPRKYTRMWLSNVPDYTHGPMNMIIYVVPNLQEDPQAAVACNSLYNTGAWAGDEEFFHTYTLLLPGEIPRYLACPIMVPRPVMDVLVLGSRLLPRPLSELATRQELLTWLTRVLFNTFIPGHSKFRPNNVRLPHNLVAFFGLVMYLHRVGYPGHWLSEFLARVLSGKMSSNVRPYDEWYPIPVSERTRRVQTRVVRTDPWLVEFETIIATAYYAIPFPIAGALSADFSRDPDDIAMWEVDVQAAQYFSTNPFMNPSSPYDPRAQLLFFRSDVTSAKTLIDEMPKIFEGKGTPPPGTFFVLTAQEYIMYDVCVRFKLSKKRVEGMRKEKWSMTAYRNDTGEQATRPAPISKWKLCNEKTSTSA